MGEPFVGAGVLVPDAFLREREVFNRLKPDLLGKHRGKYVAVYEGDVAVIGDSSAQVATEAYEKLGYVPLYIGLVEEDLPVARIPSPRAEGTRTEA
jgi:hypothetical protein